MEAVRIRVMTSDKRPEFLSFVGMAQDMLEQKGLAYFWSGLGALLFRELPFAIAKVRRVRRAPPIVATWNMEDNGELDIMSWGSTFCMHHIIVDSWNVSYYF